MVLNNTTVHGVSVRSQLIFCLDNLMAARKIPLGKDCWKKLALGIFVSCCLFKNVHALASSCRAYRCTTVEYYFRMSV